MANLFGTGINQVPTNGMLGNLAFQDKAYVSVDKVGIGTTAVDTGTANQTLQNYGGAFISGNVGIATTNPTQPLDVNGNIRIRGGLYDLNNQVGTATSVLVSTGVGVSWTPIATAALQGVQGTQGLQGVQGLQGLQGTQGVQGLQGLQGTQGVQGLSNQGVQGAAGPQTTINSTSSTAATTFYPVFVAGTGPQTASIGIAGASAFTFVPSSGNLSVGGNITAYSDESLKEDIELIKNSLEKIQKIRGVTYLRKDLENKRRQAGVIAQEVEKVLPEVVDEDENGIKKVAYGNLISIVIEAIKEQQQEINNIMIEINNIMIEIENLKNER